MKRVPVLVVLPLVAASVLAACGGASTAAPAASASPAAGGAAASSAPSAVASQAGAAASAGSGAAGGSLADIAATIKDACTVMPMDIATRLVPKGTAPQSEPFPPRCTVTDGTFALQVTLGAYDTGGLPTSYGSPVAGLGAGAFMELPLPDDAYLIVLLSPDHGQLYVEVAGHDGKDHRQDAIDVAKAVLAKLH